MPPKGQIEGELPSLRIPDKNTIQEMTDEQFQEWKVGMERCYSAFSEGHQQAHSALYDLEELQESIGI